MHFQTLLSPLLKAPRIELLSSPIWRELGTNLPSYGWMDGWVRVLHPFNSISVISRRWKGEHERLCAIKRRLGSGRISPPAGFEPATPWSEVGSANRSATRTLPPVMVMPHDCHLGVSPVNDSDSDSFNLEDCYAFPSCRIVQNHLRAQKPRPLLEFPYWPNSRQCKPDAGLYPAWILRQICWRTVKRHIIP